MLGGLVEHPLHRSVVAIGAPGSNAGREGAGRTAEICRGGVHQSFAHTAGIGALNRSSSFNNLPIPYRRKAVDFSTAFLFLGFAYREFFPAFLAAAHLARAAAAIFARPAALILRFFFATP